MPNVTKDQPKKTYPNDSWTCAELAYARINSKSKEEHQYFGEIWNEYGCPKVWNAPK